MTAFFPANRQPDRKKTILAKVGFDENGRCFLNAAK